MIEKIKSFITVRMIVLIFLLVIASVFMVFSFINKEKSSNLNKANSLYEKGIQKIEEKKYKEAVEFFTQAIKIDPKSDQAYAKRGAVTAEFLKQYKEAMQDYDKALELNPKDALTLHNRAICKIELKQLNSAIEDLTKAVIGSPTYYIAHNTRGVAHGMLGEYEKAITDFESALKINPEYINAKVNKIFAKFKMGKKDEALEEAKGLLGGIDKKKQPADYEKVEKIIDYIEQTKQSVFRKSL